MRLVRKSFIRSGGERIIFVDKAQVEFGLSMHDSRDSVVILSLL